MTAPSIYLVRESDQGLDPQISEPYENKSVALHAKESLNILALNRDKGMIFQIILKHHVLCVLTFSDSFCAKI